MAEQASGIELMRRRMERARRQPPPPQRRRGAGAKEAEAPGASGAAPAAQAPVEPRPAQAGGRPPADRAQGRTSARAPLRLGPDLPPVNLAIRVRKPLDDRLADLIHDLRHDGVRTSKVELIEMLLWELPEDDPAGARERLRRFRAFAPRGAGAPLEEG